MPSPDTTPVAPLTMGKFKASKMIVMQSWALLIKDKEIMWFPVLSGIANIIAVALFSSVIFFVALGGAFSGIGSIGEVGANIVFYIALFIYYLVMFFISNFFIAGMYIIAHGRFNQQDLSFTDGMNGAKENIGKIFWWSAISATVGVLLKIIEDRFRLGKIISFILGSVWGILTYFSLPSLIIGKTSVKESFKQSASVIRKTWGETIIVNLGVGLFVTLLFFLAIAIAVGVIVLVPIAPVVLSMVILLFIFLIVLIVVSTALSSIFKLAIYEYATTGRVPEGFSPELIQNAVRAN